MKQWFKQLAPRERRAIIYGAVALGSILVYFMLWAPFVTARTQLENIVAAQKATLHWMQAAALEVQQLRHQSRTSPAHKQSLLSLIDQSTLGKARKRIEPKGEREVWVNFEEVSFTELIRWLGQLYNQHQVQISTISIERLDTSDRVKVRLMLKI
ncbi:MAG: type II secretion system protein M [Pseudomonadota bacterium]